MNDTNRVFREGIVYRGIIFENFSEQKIAIFK